MSTTASGPPTSRRLGEQIRYWLPAVVVFGLGLAAWQWLLPDVLGVEEFLLPRFSDVVQALVDERDELLRGAWITFKEAFGGFVLGSGTAFLVALVLARWRPFGNALMPYMIAANAIPIIAFAPITNAWFGLLSPWSKVTIAAVLCFFPVLVNTLRGLTSVDPESHRAHALLRGTTARGVPPSPDPELAPVRLHRLEGGERACDDRRRRGRLLRRVLGRAGDRRPERRQPLAVRAYRGQRFSSRV